MNREKTAECIKIMQAFVDGKQIEFKDCMGHWSEAKNPLWDWDSGAMYRIKPKPEYRPFKDENECRQEMLKHTAFGYVTTRNQYYSIAYFNYRGATLSVGKELIDFSYEEMLEFTFLDGTPFGIKDF